MQDAADPTAERELTEPWLEVARDRLGRELASVRGVARARRNVLDSLGTLARRPRAGAQLDPDLESLLQAIGLGMERDGDAARELTNMIDRGEAAGLNRSALPQVVQAYVRAVGRIVAVESSLVLGRLREVDRERRPAVIVDLVDELLPISNTGFDTLHRAMLLDALLEGAGAVDSDQPVVERLAIGMVDLVRSTDYLKRASVLELEQLVDAIFRAGQAATAERSAHIVKYVGDGLFIAAADVATVSEASLDTVARLEDQLPMRARGGIAYGPVVQRAGDVFGMAVNLSQALSKAARPGTVLLSGDAAEQLPGDRHGRLRRRELHHPALAEQPVATLRAKGDET